MADAVPVEWLVGSLWAVTMVLAGALGKALYCRIAEMTGAIEEIAETVHELAESHARVEERVAAAMRRIERLEGRCDDRHPPART